MALVVSGGNLADLWDFERIATGPITDASWIDWRYLAGSYAMIYRTQPNVRTVVDFISRNVAQLGVHVFEKVAHDDRRRALDHPAAQTLADPSPAADLERKTTFELMDELLHDLLIYDRAYLLKLWEGDRLRLRRLAPRWTYPVNPLGNIWAPPTVYRYRGMQDIPAAQVIAIRGYDPDAYLGVSPMETLRLDLELDIQGQVSQLQLYRNGARMRGWIERPLDAPDWAPDKRERFREQWKSQWTGEGPDAMGTPVLEDGMKFHSDSFSPEQTRYLEERRLSMQRACAAYFVHPVMLGIDQGTLANTREIHQMLYQDTLGPTVTRLEQRLGASLLTEWPDASKFYIELNIAEKLEGDFEQQSVVLQRATGRPWMSANEARLRQNLPRIDEPQADALVVPLNVLVAGQPSPPKPTPAPPEASRDAGAKLSRAEIKARTQQQVRSHVEQLSGELRAFFERQRRAVLAGLKGQPPLHDAWDADRWHGELSPLLLKRQYAVAQVGAQQVLDEYDPEYDWADEPMLPYLATVTDSAATAINLATYSALVAAVAQPDWRAAVGDVFALAVDSRADELAETQLRGALSFGGHDAARAVGLRSKTWIVTAANPRPSHADLDGETVDLEDTFSNGGKWPGDPNLPEDERVNCSCDVDFSRGED